MGIFGQLTSLHVYRCGYVCEWICTPRYSCAGTRVFWLYIHVQMYKCKLAPIFYYALYPVEQYDLFLKSWLTLVKVRSGPDSPPSLLSRKHRHPTHKLFMVRTNSTILRVCMRSVCLLNLTFISSSSNLQGIPNKLLCACGVLLLINSFLMDWLSIFATLEPFPPSYLHSALQYNSFFHLWFPHIMSWLLY